MAQPKIGAMSQACKKPRSHHKAPQQPQGIEQELKQTVEFVNLDEIPSPNVEPVIPTLMVEETQPKTMVGMDIDMMEMGQG
jgi:hypothetical protein